jgi:hypothetical protein
MVGLARQPQVSGGFDTPHGREIERIHCLFKRGSRLYLNDENNVTTPCYEVDLAQPCAVSTIDYAITFQHQCEGSEAFGGMAAAVGPVALVHSAHFKANSRW